MPNKKEDSRFVDQLGTSLKVGVSAIPLSLGVQSVYENLDKKGLFQPVRQPSSSSFISNLRGAGLQPNRGIDFSFLGSNQLFFKKEPELARTAWIQAVQSTDPFAQKILTFAGDIQTAPASDVISSIEQTLQRNNSVFMARIYNKFKSNVAALRKHQEITGRLPSFQAVEGLTFPAPRNVSINKLPTEIRAFHERFIKDTGITAAGGVRYYTRPGWEGYGTYVMPFMKGKMPFEISVPMSRGGVMIEGLTQSARRVAHDVGILDPMSGAIERLKRHEFYLRDIEQSILPRITSGEYRSAWEIERAIGQAYERNIYSLEAVPNLPRGFLSRAWRSYSQIKGKAIDVVTQGKLGELRPGETYRSIFGGLTEQQFKDVVGRPGIYPFASPKNLAKGRFSSFDATQWFMTPEDVDWGRQPRQALRQWRADDRAVAEMLMTGNSKWSIFETQAWRRDFGRYSAPWIPTVYVDPTRYGQTLEQLGMKEGEALISRTFAKQLGVVGQPFPVHLGAVAEGLSERIKAGSLFEVGEILGQTPEGKNIVYERGMRLLGLEPFETKARGQEFALMFEQRLPSEVAAKRFGAIKAVEKLTDPWALEKAFGGISPDIGVLQGKFRVANIEELTKDRAKLNTQIITGLWEKISRDRTKNFIEHNQRLASFMRNPRVYSSFMRQKYGSAGFMEQMMRLAVQEARFTPEEFGTIFGALDPAEYTGIVPKRFAEQMRGISFGLSQAVLHEPMRMTGAGALGSIEPRMFDIFGGGQFGALGEQMSTEMATRLAATNPQKLAMYENLTKTLASYAGKVTPGKADAIWDIATKGYTQKAFQSFIEGGGGFMKLGRGLPDIFVPGGDVLTPYKTPVGKVIAGDVAMEYHRLARGVAEIHTQAKRVDIQAAGELVNGFIRNIHQQQAPFGSGAGGIGRGQVFGSRFLRGVSEWGGQRAPGAMTIGIPQFIGEELFEEMGAVMGESVQEMNERFLAGRPVGGMIWRHPLAGPYSVQPINIQMMKGVTEPVVVMPSKMVDIGMKNPIELSPMVGMGMDLDADIASVSLVSPDLEKNIRKSWTYADNQYTQAYMEHTVRAQIIKTKAAGGAAALAAQEKKVADAMKLAIGQQWIGKLSLQFSGARKAATQRLSGQQAANVAFTLNWLEESILKAKHLPGERVVSGEFSGLLATVESAFETKNPRALEGIVRSMLEQDELSRKLLEQEVRIPQNIEAVREATGVKSMRRVLPALNIKETARDIMTSMEWAESTGLEEMTRAAAGRRPMTPGVLGKYLSFTGSVLGHTKGMFAGVSEAAIVAKNTMASIGAGVIRHKKPLGWGFAGSLAIASILSKPEDLTGIGAELVPEAKTASEFNKAAMRMKPENILPPGQPVGEPTVSPVTAVPSVRVLPGAESRNINIRARASSKMNTEDMVRRYRRQVNSNRVNVNVRDNTSTLSKYDIADRILK
jgi:hypothetical protein